MKYINFILCTVRDSQIINFHKVKFKSQNIFSVKETHLPVLNIVFGE